MSVPSLPGKIVAVAKNFAAHALEMGGSAAKPARPTFFIKPASSVVLAPQPILRPARCAELHHEVELGVVISRRCSGAAAADWRSYVAGYRVALDMTARDLQAQAKAAGQPWTLGKCWDTFTPLGPTIPAEAFARDPHDVELWLAVDGAQRQRGSTAGMLFRIPELIQEISAVMTLEAGDVILTGTPEGVGPVEPGQTITCGITGVTEMSFRVEQAPRR